MIKRKKEISVDIKINMANSIAGQILNNEICKKDYARILSLAMLKISDALESDARFNATNIMSEEERERKFKIYREEILPKYGNDPDKVPPYLEPDFNEGWK